MLRASSCRLLRALQVPHAPQLPAATLSAPLSNTSALSSAELAFVIMGARDLDHHDDGGAPGAATLGAELALPAQVSSGR